MVIATSQHRPFQVAELAEQKQGVVAGALDMLIVRRAFLIAMW